jgi:hypothetical protein
LALDSVQDLTYTYLQPFSSLPNNLGSSGGITLQEKSKTMIIKYNKNFRLPNTEALQVLPSKIQGGSKCVNKWLVILCYCSGYFYFMGILGFCKKSFDI